MKSSVVPYAEFRAGLQAVVVSVMFVDLEHLLELAFTDTSRLLHNLLRCHIIPYSTLTGENIDLRILRMTNSGGLNVG